MFSAALADQKDPKRPGSHADEMMQYQILQRERIALGCEVVLMCDERKTDQEEACPVARGRGTEREKTCCSVANAIGCCLTRSKLCPYRHRPKLHHL